MTLSYLSGDGRRRINPNIQSQAAAYTDVLSGDDVGKSKKAAARKEKRKETKAKIKAAPKGKERRKVRKAEGAGVLRKVAKFNAAPVRLAFLGLVELNLLKVASKLAEAYKKNPAKVKAFWQKFGGDEAKLKKAIEHGAKSKLSGAEIGNPAAVLAAATPAVIAVVKLFKELGIGTGKGEGKGADLDAAIIQAKADVENNPEVEKTEAEMPENADIAKLKTKEQQQTESGGGTNASFATGTIENLNDFVNFLKGAGVMLLGLSFNPKLLVYGNIIFVCVLCYSLRNKIKYSFHKLLNL